MPQLAARPGKPGATHQFFTRPAFAVPPGLPFCTALILTCETEPLGVIDDAGAIAEGYSTRDEFKRVWCDIWGASAWVRDRTRDVFVVRFEVATQLACAKCWETPAIEGQLRAWQGSPELYCIFCHGTELAA